MILSKIGTDSLLNNILLTRKIVSKSLILYLYQKKKRIITTLIFILFFGACVSCYNGDKTLIPYEVFVPKEVEDGFVLKFQPKVDILLFIDDSGSMGVFQTSLAKNVDKFIGVMEKNEFLDYHIGVLKISGRGSEGASTSAMAMGWGNSSVRNGNAPGKMVGDPYFITRDTPEGLSQLKENILMRNSGASSIGTELFFSPLFSGFNQRSELNQGFLRPDAFLALIIIADTFDQSQETSGFKVYNELVLRKANDPLKVLGYGAIAYPEFFEDGCGREEDLHPPWTDNLFDFLFRFVNSRDSKIGGGIHFTPVSEIVEPEHYAMTNVFSLCDKNFGKKIANIGEDIRIRVSKRIPLPVRPIDGSIRVKNGDKFIDKNLWRHDFRSNSIVLSSQALLSQGQDKDRFFVVMDEADPLNTLGKPPSLKGDSFPDEEQN